MNRCAFVSAAALFCLLAFVVATSAQTAKPATSAAQSGSTAPAAPAKFVTMQKGLATIDVLQGLSKRSGKDIVTVLRVKNTSPNALGLLRCDELWYDKNLKQVSGDSQTVKRVMPGEIVEITMKSPSKPDLYRSQYAFSYINGTIKAKAVKSFPEDAAHKK
jgi:hypothetical protein